MSLCYLLAAGEGRRLRPYTETRIKPRFEFLNLPLAFYGSFLALKGGFKNLLINKHHLPDQVEILAQELAPFFEKVKTIDETQKLLGSGGALWNARKTLSQHEHFMIANGDEVLLSEDTQVVEKLVDRFQHTKSIATLLTCDHPELLKTLKAVWVNDQDEVRGFGLEAPEPGLKPVHYTGYKIFDRKILDWLPEGESNIFYDILVGAISKGEKVQTLHLPRAIWHETGNFDSFLNASQDITECGWSYVQDRLTYFKRPKNQLKKQSNGTVIYSESNTTIDFSKCTGTVVIGDTAFNNNTLENVIVQNGSVLQEDKNYSNQMIL